MSEWQPIETAPKDGTIIDLWMQSLGLVSRDKDDLRVYVEFRVCDCFFQAGGWTDEQGVIADWQRHMDYGSALVPSHWMPRPLSPNAKGETHE